MIDKVKLSEPIMFKRCISKSIETPIIKNDILEIDTTNNKIISIFTDNNKSNKLINDIISSFTLEEINETPLNILYLTTNLEMNNQIKNINDVIVINYRYVYDLQMIVDIIKNTNDYFLAIVDADIDNIFKSEHLEKMYSDIKNIILMKNVSVLSLNHNLVKPYQYYFDILDYIFNIKANEIERDKRRD